MSNAPANNLALERSEGLKRAKIRQLLAAIGSKPADDAQIEVTEYDWHQPHYFSSSQLAKLNNFTKKVATVMAEKFAQLYHGDFNVNVTSTRQHFAGELFEQILSSGQNDYYLAFGPNQQHLSGFISIPAQTAVAWAKQLLGDAEPDKDASGELPSKALSQLEESLLFDIACSIVESLSISLRSCVPEHDFHPASGLVKGSAFGGHAELHGTAELCKITFDVQKAGSEDNAGTAPGGNQAHLLIPANMLAPIVGKITETDKKLSAQDISKAILEHLQQMPISIMAQLAVAVLTFEQLMSLRPSDVLLLNKAIDEPVELIAEGRPLFRGQPAKSSGQHAVVITELSGHTEQNVNLVTGT